MLARIRKAMDEKDEGFTLIELLVVMIIIGILAAIAIPVFLNQRRNAVDSSVKSDLRTIANELESVYTDTEAYPASFAATAAVSIGGEAVETSGANTYAYTLAASGEAYCILGDPGAKGTHAWVYKSDAGGLQPSSVVTCA